MMTIPDPRRGLVRGWGLAAAAILALALPGPRAEALSLINPAAAPAAKHASDALTTEVRGGHGHGGGGGGGGFRGGGGGGGGGFRGGGAAFHGGGGGGGFRGGGAVFHGGGGGGGFRGAVIQGGGFRGAGPVFRGGGGGYRYAAPGIVRQQFAPRRAHFHHRHHFRPRYYGGYTPYYYPRYSYYPKRYCKIVYTYYGPRKICRYRPWHQHWRYRPRLRLPIYW